MSKLHYHRILIDHSGYHLKNLGDVAMLQAAVKRIQQILPSASISAICTDPQRLSRVLPNIHAIDHHIPALAHQTKLFPIPHRFIPKKLLPAVLSKDRINRILKPEKWAKKDNPSQWVRMISKSDAVVATGGGYLTDSFPDHALGLLTNLSLAQYLGKPTAFFGQGVGPLSNSDLQNCVSTILFRAQVIGLREKVTGPQELTRFGIDTEKASFTGDDALELIPEKQKHHRENRTVGLNIRISNYSGFDERTLGFLRQELKELTINLGCNFCPLPIDFVNPDANDETHVLNLIDRDIADFYSTPQSPDEVIRMASRCAITITGSYHAALFSLAQGIPVIGIQMSIYYQSKFDGLKEIYKNGVQTYNPSNAPCGELLKKIKESLSISEGTKGSWIFQSQRLRKIGKNLYTDFFKTQKCLLKTE